MDSVKKKKMRKMLYAYLTLLGVLVFASRTLYNWSLPRVTVAMSHTGVIVRELEAQGMVAFVDTHDVFAVASGWVDEVGVSTGDKVVAGDVLLSYTLAERVEEQLQTLATEQARLHNALNLLALGRGDIEHQLAVTNSQTFDEHVAEVVTDLRSYKWALADAYAQLTAAQESLLVSQQLVSAGAQPLVYLENAQTAVADATSAWERAADNLSSAQERIVREQVTQASDRERARLAFEEAQAETYRTLTLELQRIELEIDRTHLDLRTAEQAQAQLATIDQHVQVLANQTGYMMAIDKQPGQFISQGERIATVGLQTGVFELTFESTVAVAGFVNVGSVSSILRAGTNVVLQGVVDSIVATGEQLSIRLLIESNELSGGEFVRVRFHEQLGPYEMVVPNEAVQIGGVGQYYIWTVQPRDGALGREYISVRRSVRVLASDAFHSAVDLGGWGAHMPVITSSNAELSVNGRVSRME